MVDLELHQKDHIALTKTTWLQISSRIILHTLWANWAGLILESYLAMLKTHMESKEAPARSQAQPQLRTGFAVKVQWTSYRIKSRARVLPRPLVKEASSAAQQWRAPVSDLVAWAVAPEVTPWEQSTTHHPTIQIIMAEGQCSVATRHLNLSGRIPKVCTLTSQAADTWCMARARPHTPDQARWRHPIEKLKKHKRTCKSYSKLIKNVLNL